MSTMLIPIVCTRCGNTGKVASLPSDLACAACKTGAYLDLDDRVAGLDPTDPMPLLPGGVPDENRPVEDVDPERVKNIAPVPGQAPYTDRALADPLNQSRAAAPTLGSRKVAVDPGWGQHLVQPSRRQDSTEDMTGQVMTQQEAQDDERARKQRRMDEDEGYFEGQGMWHPVNSSRHTATPSETEWYVARVAPETPRGFADDIGPFATEAEAQAAVPQDGNTWTTYPRLSTTDQAAYERFMTGSLKTAQAVTIGRSNTVHDYDEELHDVFCGSAAHRGFRSVFTPSRLEVNCSRCLARRAKADQVAQAVLASNPGMSHRTAMRVARKTVARYLAPKQASAPDLCSGCFAAQYGEEPDMGMDGVTFHPGTCSRCGFQGVVFSLTDDALETMSSRKQANLTTSKGFTLDDDQQARYDALSPLAQYGPDYNRAIGDSLSRVRNAEDRADVEMFLGDAENAAGKTSSRKQAMPNPADSGIKVGDVFYSSWGYDQTNINFYEVTGLTGASVKVREVSKSVQHQGQGSDSVTPVPGAFVGEEMTRRFNDSSGYGRPAIKIDQVQTAWLWDGKPKYQTAQGWGH